MNNSAPAEVSAEFVRDRRAVNGEACARQCFKRSTQGRIADEVVRPGNAAAQNERHAGDQCRRIEAAADLSAYICGIHRGIGKSEAATRDVALAVGWRMEVLRLQRHVRSDSEGRQYAKSIAAF